MKKTTNFHRYTLEREVCQYKINPFFSFTRSFFDKRFPILESVLPNPARTFSLLVGEGGAFPKKVDPLKMKKRACSNVASAKVRNSPFSKENISRERGRAAGLFSKEKRNSLLVNSQHFVVKEEQGERLRRVAKQERILQFLKSSSHFGRKTRHLDFSFPWHASMCNKLSGVRNKVAHVDSQQTLQSLARAFYSIALVLRKGGKVLVVNKKSEFFPLFYLDSPNSRGSKMVPLSDTLQSKVQKRRKSFKGSQNSSKIRPARAPLSWVGGCLTNWKEISKSVATLLYFSKRFGGFIKQNNIHFPRFNKMKTSFQGFIDIEREELLLKERPQLLFLFDANESQQIIHEATALQIPVVALTDSSTNLSQITYPIPINSDSIHLIHWCLSQLMQITERQGGFSK